MICICPNCSNVFEYAPPVNERKKMSINDAYKIIELCCDHFGVKHEKIFSKCRQSNTVKARQVAMYLIYREEKHSGISLHQIGKLFNRDHTTVLNARKRCKNALFTKGDVYNDLLLLNDLVEEMLSDNPLKVAV